MSTAQLTEERLKSWLDGNQVQRERMCIAILALTKQYSDVRPRRPKGGPDGARDIEALYEGTYEVWGAVGFQNSVTDSSEDKRLAQRKFRSDLKSALTENPSLQYFVFFTNVDFKPSEERSLIEEANQKGIRSVEIFWRERLRIVLDSPEGLGLRYQYLRINLSEAEQAAFFERFGSQLEQIVVQKFQAVDTSLARLEFLVRSTKPIFSFGVIIKLKRRYTWDEMGHPKYYLEFRDDNKVNPTSLIMGERDSLFRFTEDDKRYSLRSIEQFILLENPNCDVHVDYARVPKECNELGFMLNLNSIPSLNSLSDFDRKSVRLYTTQDLFDKFVSISILVNHYTIGMAYANELKAISEDEFRKTRDHPDWLEPSILDEEPVYWIMAVPKEEATASFPLWFVEDNWSFNLWNINFDVYTPRKNLDSVSIYHDQQESLEEARPRGIITLINRLSPKMRDLLDKVTIHIQDLNDNDTEEFLTKLEEMINNVQSPEDS